MWVMLLMLVHLFETKTKVGLGHVVNPERISAVENLITFGCCLDARTEWTVYSFSVLIEETAGLSCLVYPEFELLFRCYMLRVFS